MGMHRNHRGRIRHLVGWILLSLCLMPCGSIPIDDQPPNFEDTDSQIISQNTPIANGASTATPASDGSNTDKNDTTNAYTTDPPEYVTEIVTEIDEVDTTSVATVEIMPTDDGQNGQNNDHQTEILTEVTELHTAETERTPLDNTEQPTTESDTSGPSGLTTETAISTAVGENEEYVTEIQEIVYTVDMGTETVEVDDPPSGTTTKSVRSTVVEENEEYVTEIQEIVYTVDMGTEIVEVDDPPSGTTTKSVRSTVVEENEEYVTEIQEIVNTVDMGTETVEIDDPPSELTTKPARPTVAEENEEYVTEIQEIVYTVDMGTEIVELDDAPVDEPPDVADGPIVTSTPESRTTGVTKNDYWTEVVTEIDEVVYTEEMSTDGVPTKDVTDSPPTTNSTTRGPHTERNSEMMNATGINATVDPGTGVGASSPPTTMAGITSTARNDATASHQSTQGTITSSKEPSTTLKQEAATTEATNLEDSHLYFQFVVGDSFNITDKAFVLDLEQKLANVLESTEPASTQSRRRRRQSPELDDRMSGDVILSRERRAVDEDITVKVRMLARNSKDPSILDVYFTVEVNGTTIASNEAAARFVQVSDAKMSAVLGHEVLSVPVAVNEPEAIVSPSDKFEPPSGDLGDFLMIVLLVPLDVDIGGPVFQTDVAHGLEAIYLTGVEMASAGRRRRDAAALLDVRTANVSDTEKSRVESSRNMALLDRRILDEAEREDGSKADDMLHFSANPRQNRKMGMSDRALFYFKKIMAMHGRRRRRESILNPSDDYSVNLKSVHRPVQTKMKVEIVFSVILNGEVVTGKDALGYFSKVSIMFMKEVLVYHVEEPGVFLFQLKEDSTIWIIIFIDIAVVIVLLIILIVYCRYVKYKRSEMHKQAILNKKERSTSIEVGFVRIGVPTEDRAALEDILAHDKSGSHAMHGTVQDKLKKKRRKGVIGNGSSSDEETSSDLVRPSQLFAASGSQDTQALVSASEGDTNRQEFVRRFKKRDHDESVRKQQELQDQLNLELARRLGAPRPSHGETSGLQQQGETSGSQQKVGEMMEEAGGFGIADKISGVLSDVMEFLGLHDTEERLHESDSSSWSSSGESYTSDEEDYREEDLP